MRVAWNLWLKKNTLTKKFTCNVEESERLGFVRVTKFHVLGRFRGGTADATESTAGHGEGDATKFHVGRCPGRFAQGTRGTWCGEVTGSAADHAGTLGLDEENVVGSSTRGTAKITEQNPRRK